MVKRHNIKNCRKLIANYHQIDYYKHNLEIKYCKNQVVKAKSLMSIYVQTIGN